MAVKKILMLHGYSQNSIVFYKRLGAIRRACGKSIDFVFVDAPHVLQPVDLQGFNSSSLGAGETKPQSDNPEDIPRGWWRTNPERTLAIGIEESLQTLKEVLVKDTYEGVFGFSQGAAMAALLTALLERPDFHPPFLVDGKPPHPPMKFCISIAGFKPITPTWTPLFTPPFQTPTLHVIGTNDVIVVPERAHTLVAASANARVATHDGGHFVPTKQSWRHFLRDYLRDPFGDVPNPPGPGEQMPDVSAPVSVAATPVASVPASGRASPSTDADVAPVRLGVQSITKESPAVVEDKPLASSNL